MFNKPLKDIEYQDVEDLILVHQQNEGLHIEFKGEPKNLDTFSNELVKDFSSFANSNGGYIILGVEEKETDQGKEFSIKGFLKQYGGKNLVEWINQKMIGNVEPRLFYPDPRPVEIPGSTDRFLFVYYIPESTSKPHFNNVKDCYNIRVNDISIAAKHYQIRDMFESTRRRYDEFNDFLDRRNLLDEYSDDFGLTPNSRQISTNEFASVSNTVRPLLILSFIPKFPNNQIIQSYKQEFINWIVQNSKGFGPFSWMSVFPTNNTNFNLHGLVLKNNDNKSYIEFQNNGYTEVGLCDSIFRRWTPEGQNEEISGLHITYCAGYIIAILSFIKKYYDYIGYEEELTFQLSFRNVLGINLMGFNESRRNIDWRWLDDLPQNNTHKNFRIIQKLIPTNLGDERIIQIAKNCIEKIMLACNCNDFTLCFIEDNIDLNKFRSFKIE